MIKQQMQELLYQTLLSIHWHEDENGVILRSLICKRKGKELLIDQQLPEYHSVETLVAVVDTKLPVVLTITGKGILQSTNVDPSKNWPELLHQRLPGADPLAFSGQVMQSLPILNIARRDRIDEVLMAFSSHNLQVVVYYMGTIPMDSILPVFNRHDPIIAPPFSLQFESGSFTGLGMVATDTNSLAIEISGQRILNQFLLCFAGAVAQMLSYSPLPHNNTLATGKRSYELDQYTRWAGLAGLGTIFLALLINFLVYSQTSRSLSQVEGELYYSQGLIGQRDSLSEQVKQRQAALGDQIIRQSQLSRLADQLALNMPMGIRLRELALFPIEKASPNDRSGQVNYQDDTILLRGQTKENSLINAWITELHDMEWIEDVQILPYRLKQGGVVDFELKLLLAK